MVFAAIVIALVVIIAVLIYLVQMSRQRELESKSINLKSTRKRK